MIKNKLKLKTNIADLKDDMENNFKVAENCLKAHTIYINKLGTKIVNLI